jgi:hypothetical protein
VLTYAVAALLNASPVRRLELSIPTFHPLAGRPDTPVQDDVQICPGLRAPTSFPVSSTGFQDQQHEEALRCFRKRDKRDAPWGNGVPPTISIAPFPNVLPYQAYKDQCSANSQILTKMIENWVKSVSSSRARDQTYDSKAKSFGIQGGACISTSFVGPVDKLPMYAGKAWPGSSKWPPSSEWPSSSTRPSWTPEPWSTTTSPQFDWPSSSLPWGSRSWGGTSNVGGNNGPAPTWGEGGFRDPSYRTSTSTVYVTLPPESTSTYVTFR